MASKLPWWLGLVLAVMSYVGLHQLGVSSPESLIQPDAATQGVAEQAAGVNWVQALKMVLPLFFIIGALVSWRRRNQASTVHDVPCAEALQDMSWQEFGLLIVEAFRLQGYRVQEAGSERTGGEIDLVLVKGQASFLVLCTQWKTLDVSVGTVRELLAVMPDRGAVGGFVVTLGTFSHEAQRFAEGHDIRLIGCTGLHHMIGEARSSLNGQGGVGRHVMQ